VVEDKIDETLDGLQRETKALLREHWPAVKRVAKALFVRDRLDHAEVERLIAGRTHTPQMAPQRPRLAPRGNHSPGDERVRPRYRRLGAVLGKNPKVTPSFRPGKPARLSRSLAEMPPEVQETLVK
jgi:hypothetical protein